MAFAPRNAGLLRQFVSACTAAAQSCSSPVEILEVAVAAVQNAHASQRRQVGFVRPCFRTFASQAMPSDGPTEVVHLDESAVHRVREIQAETPNTFLRVAVDAGGCSGFQYIFELDSAVQDDDMPGKQLRCGVCEAQTRSCWRPDACSKRRLVERDGVPLMVIDKVSREFLKGSTVEFAEDLMSASFRVKDNPNSESGCGCGASFAAKS